MTTKIKLSSLVGWCPVCGMKQRFRNIPVNRWHDVKCGICKSILNVKVLEDRNGAYITHKYDNKYDNKYETTIIIFRKQIEIQRSYDGIIVDFVMDKPKHKIPYLDQIIMELDTQIDEYAKIRKKDEELESFILADLAKSRYDRVLRTNKIREELHKYNEFMENNYIANSTLMDVICTKCLSIMKLPYGKCILPYSNHRCEHCGNHTTVVSVTKLYTNTSCEFDDGVCDIRISFTYEQYFDQCTLNFKIYESVDPFMCSMLNFGKERYSSEYVSEPIKQFSTMKRKEKLKTMDNMLQTAYKLWKEGKIDPSSSGYQRIQSIIHQIMQIIIKS